MNDSSYFERKGCASVVATSHGASTETLNCLIRYVKSVTKRIWRLAKRDEHD